MYETQKAGIIQDLRTNQKSLVHVFFDLWTSPIERAYMAVVIHYVNQNYKNRTRLIALRHLCGAHDRENQTQLLVQVFWKYKLKGLLGYFVLDNASNCDTSIDAVL